MEEAAPVMTARKVFIEVVTPERTVLQEEAVSVIVPGMQGVIGIQYNHAPMVVGLRPGVLLYGDVDKEKARLAVSGGFVEVSNNRVQRFWRMLLNVPRKSTWSGLKQSSRRKRAQKRLLLLQ